MLWACGNHSGLLKTLPQQAVEEGAARGPGGPGLRAWPSHGRGPVRLDFVTARSGPVRLAVYDAAGQLVGTLVQGSRPQGRHRLTWDPGELARGVYLCRLETGEGERVAKVCRQ